MASAFLIGTVFYILRRTTGSLVWAMVLHGLWDFSVFAVGHGTAGPIAGLIGVLQLVVGVLGPAVVWFTFRNRARTSAADAGGPSTAAV